MTGFGRASLEASFGRITVEVQSVNRRYLEIFVSLPKELIRFEHHVRKVVNEKLTRGQVSIRVYLIPNLEAIESLLPDVEVLKELKKAWKKIAQDLGADPKKIDLSFIMQHLPQLPKQESGSDEDGSSLIECVESAIKALKKMKKTEGKALSKDLSDRLKTLEKMVQEVEKNSGEASEKMRAKLLEKVQEVVGGQETDDRVLREVAVFAERVDTSEEITRFKSHIAQFKTLFKEPVVGRKMDFLIQEMGREINTITSKAMEAKVSHLVVDMKSELEKMREQVQNIE